MSGSRHPALSSRGRQNLAEAMKEEAFALAKCKVLAQQARKQRQAKLAALLDKIADQHYLKHFAAQAELLGLSPLNQQELARELTEESSVVGVMCKLYAREATQDGDISIAHYLNQMSQDELLNRTELAEAFKYLRIRRAPSTKTKKG